jgi:hypothetical protein
VAKRYKNPTEKYPAQENICSGNPGVGKAGGKSATQQQLGQRKNWSAHKMNNYK